MRVLQARLAGCLDRQVTSANLKLLRDAFCSLQWRPGAGTARGQINPWLLDGCSTHDTFQAMLCHLAIAA